ncbi:ABC transporter substrate-binding protein [Lederbergia lenta]|uniref:ABC transporter substrate-binding protein n=1 Tax=Lederbergia lenta TaxID=1467 RepID=UPI00204092FB|nr:ABC transporter substrate-binding protein [Lederbergia lenta]MCM3112357.1 ABC transporter substrate-binding protein [Lederbergia lenta]
MIKNKWLVYLSFILTIAIGGCSSSGNKDTSIKQNQEIVTLRLAWWGEQPRHEYMMKVIELYEKKNPHIHIEPEYANWDDYWKRIAPMAAGNELPDIMQMDLLYLRPYASNQLLEDLTTYIEENVIGTQSISREILKGGVINNQLYGFPLGLNAPAVIVDHALFHSAQTVGPKSNWTWDEFEDTAIEVHDQLDIFGTNGMKPPEVFFPYYLRTQGENFYNEEGTSLGYKDDQLFINYFNLQLQLVKKGAFPKPNVTEQIKVIEDELLVSQLSPMTWSYSNQYFGFLYASKRPLELYPPPRGNLNDGLLVRPSMFFSIGKNSMQKEEAAKFIHFFTNDVEANQLIQGERGVPVSTKIANDLYPNLNNEQKKVFDYVNQVREISEKVESPDPIGAIQIVAQLQSISEQILFEKITPAEGAKLFRKEANRILSKNNIYVKEH